MNTNLNIKIDDGLLRLAKQASDEEERTLSNYIRWLITKDLKKRGLME